MRSSDLSRVTWRKSSRSNGGVDGNCVEIAEVPGRVALRDSKNPTGPVLAFSADQWRAFVGGVRTGRFG